MPVPIPYRKFCSGGNPVLKPTNSPGRFSAMATTAAIEAQTTYKTEHAISRLRDEGEADCCTAVGVDMLTFFSNS